MKNKEQYYKALIRNKGKLNEIDLGESLYLNEKETRDIISQLLAEHKIKYAENGTCSYMVTKKTSR